MIFPFYSVWQSLSSTFSKTYILGYTKIHFYFTKQSLNEVYSSFLPTNLNVFCHEVDWLKTCPVSAIDYIDVVDPIVSFIPAVIIYFQKIIFSRFKKYQHV